MLCSGFSQPQFNPTVHDKRTIESVPSKHQIMCTFEVYLVQTVILALHRVSFRDEVMSKMVYGFEGHKVKDGIWF